MDKLLSSPLENAFKTFDITLTGSYSIPKSHVRLFYYRYYFAVGPVPMMFSKSLYIIISFTIAPLKSTKKYI